MLDMAWIGAREYLIRLAVNIVDQGLIMTE